MLGLVFGIATAIVVYIVRMVKREGQGPPPPPPAAG
jgi:hypothetical protein